MLLMLLLRGRVKLRNATLVTLITVVILVTLINFAQSAYFPLHGGANVGIGNTAPVALLHIGSGGTPNYSATGDVYIQNDLEVDGTLNGDGGGIVGIGASGWNHDSGVVRLTTSTDNVGIGTTGAEGKLEVEGAEATDATFVLDADDGDDNADTWTIKSAIASNNELQFFNYSTMIMELESGAVHGSIGPASQSSFAFFEVQGGNILLDNTYAYMEKGSNGSFIEMLTIDASNNLILNTGISPADGSFQISVQNATGIYQFFTNGTEKVRFTNAGNVGIGVTNPAEVFDIVGDIQFNTDIANDTSIGVCKNNADGTSADTEFRECNGAPSDIAEWYEAKQGVGVGDIVSLTGEIFEYEEELVNPRTGLPVVKEGVQPDEHGNYQPQDKIKVERKLSVLDKATENSIEKIIGVVSTSPYQSFGKGVFVGTNPQPIALIGRVPTKVSLENGEIEIGDLITVSSQPGVGMKAIKAGRVIGYALEPFKDSPGREVGQTMVFINPHWWGGNDERDSISQRIEYFETVQAGMSYQLVSIDENQRIKPAVKEDKFIVGVIGDQEFRGGRYPVILGGRTKTRVRGRVQFGDRLTASMEEGLLEKAKEGEDVFATALESGSGIVEVMVKFR